MKLILYAKKDIKTNVKNQSRNLDALLFSPTFLPYIINKRDYSNKKHPSRMTVNYDRQNERHSKKEGGGRKYFGYNYKIKMGNFPKNS